MPATATATTSSHTLSGGQRQGAIEAARRTKQPLCAAEEPRRLLVGSRQEAVRQPSGTAPQLLPAVRQRRCWIDHTGMDLLFDSSVVRCDLQGTNCKLQITNCKLQITNCKLQITNYKLQKRRFSYKWRVAGKPNYKFMIFDIFDKTHFFLQNRPRDAGQLHGYRFDMPRRRSQEYFINV